MTANSVEAYFRRHLRAVNNLLPTIDPKAAEFLPLDLQGLWTMWQRGETTGKSAVKSRILKYRVIPCFFFYQVNHGLPTDLRCINQDHIENFLNRERREAITAFPPRNPDRSRQSDRFELYLFFSRALEANLVENNPVTPLYKHLGERLEPRNWTPQNAADFRSYKEYLDLCIASGELSPNTKSTLLRELRILFHDAEIYHESNPNWPIELDDLMTDAKWIASWIRQRKNRSSGFVLGELAAASRKKFIVSIRFLFGFLKLNGRCKNENFLEDLRRAFLNHRGKQMIPGRSSKKVGSLKEAEVDQLWAELETCDNKIKRLRDKAILVVGITTAIRLDGLYNMDILNFKKRHNEWVCYTHVKRNAQDHDRSRLQADGYEWDYWYMSPKARTAIGEYLEATDRTWETDGPIWLTLDSKRRLSRDQIAEIIYEWLAAVGREDLHPHSLRHTAATMLLVKYRLPPTLVQKITQHKSLKTLLEIYAQCDEQDAYRAVSSIYAAETEGENDYQRTLLRISVVLLELSASIGRRAQESMAFSADTVESALRTIRPIVQQLEQILANPGKKKRGRKTKLLD